MTTPATRNVQESMTEGTLFVAFELSEKTHIPSDLVVDSWTSDGERGSPRDFLFLHDI